MSSVGRFGLFRLSRSKDGVDLRHGLDSGAQVDGMWHHCFSKPPLIAAGDGGACGHAAEACSAISAVPCWPH